MAVVLLLPQLEAPQSALLPALLQQEFLQLAQPPLEQRAHQLLPAPPLPSPQRQGAARLPSHLLVSLPPFVPGALLQPLPLLPAQPLAVQQPPSEPPARQLPRLWDLFQQKSPTMPLFLWEQSPAPQHLPPIALQSLLLQVPRLLVRLLPEQLHAPRSLAPQLAMLEVQLHGARTLAPQLGVLEQTSSQQVRVRPLAPGLLALQASPQQVQLLSVQSLAPQQQASRPPAPELASPPPRSPL
mmetsp:Transcript_66992/g.218081  ORF Transcript_66992/g.218081 Transcript_66992/m.218081 type:complete len:241 (+) Transcript_66992:1522-2244(+)